MYSADDDDEKSHKSNQKSAPNDDDDLDKLELSLITVCFADSLSVCFVDNVVVERDKSAAGTALIVVVVGVVVEVAVVLQAAAVSAVVGFCFVVWVAESGSESQLAETGNSC